FASDQSFEITHISDYCVDRSQDSPGLHHVVSLLDLGGCGSKGNIEFVHWNWWVLPLGAGHLRLFWAIGGISDDLGDSED
ncbi:MAG: hypothetical protein QGG64_12800, partial [Candidatus Latescibacteria bacterium]|nr:hypothetical protein [Candidatus Latescibacterota bacterium]